MEEDAVERPIVCVSRQDVLQALNEMKTPLDLQMYHRSRLLLAAE